MRWWAWAYFKNSYGSDIVSIGSSLSGALECWKYLQLWTGGCCSLEHSHNVLNLDALGTTFPMTYHSWRCLHPWPTWESRGIRDLFWRIPFKVPAWCCTYWIWFTRLITVDSCQSISQSPLPGCNSLRSCRLPVRADDCFVLELVPEKSGDASLPWTRSRVQKIKSKRCVKSTGGQGVETERSVKIWTNDNCVFIIISPNKYALPQPEQRLLPSRIKGGILTLDAL